MKIGKGGDTRIAQLLGIDPHTVARGRLELLERDIDLERVRKRGGGRPSVEKKHRR
jgi:predicted ArsR family transcriptional regulator